MALYLTRTFQKNFEKLPKKIQPGVKEALKELYLNPLKGKRLLGDLEREFSLRVGSYRIVYFVDIDGNIWVETVRHRKEVYKRSRF